MSRKSSRCVRGPSAARRVADVPQDNDKLHYKVLQAKRNIQRMKLERA